MAPARSLARHREREMARAGKWDGGRGAGHAHKMASAAGVGHKAPRKKREEAKKERVEGRRKKAQLHSGRCHRYGVWLRAHNLGFPPQSLARASQNRDWRGSSPLGGLAAFQGILEEERTKAARFSLPLFKIERSASTTQPQWVVPLPPEFVNAGGWERGAGLSEGAESCTVQLVLLADISYNCWQPLKNKSVYNQQYSDFKNVALLAHKEKSTSLRDNLLPQVRLRLFLPGKHIACRTSIRSWHHWALPRAPAADPWSPNHQQNETNL